MTSRTLAAKADVNDSLLLWSRTRVMAAPIRRSCPEIDRGVLQTTRQRPSGPLWLVYYNVGRWQ